MKFRTAMYWILAALAAVLIGLVVLSGASAAVLARVDSVLGLAGVLIGLFFAVIVQLVPPLFAGIKWQRSRRKAVKRTYGAALLAGAVIGWGVLLVTLVLSLGSAPATQVIADGASLLWDQSVRVATGRAVSSAAPSSSIAPAPSAAVPPVPVPVPVPVTASAPPGAGHQFAKGKADVRELVDDKELHLTVADSGWGADGLRITLSNPQDSLQFALPPGKAARFFAGQETPLRWSGVLQSIARYPLVTGTSLVSLESFEARPGAAVRGSVRLSVLYQRGSASASLVQGAGTFELAITAEGFEQLRARFTEPEDGSPLPAETVLAEIQRNRPTGQAELVLFGFDTKAGCAAIGSTRPAWKMSADLGPDLNQASGKPLPMRADGTSFGWIQVDMTRAQPGGRVAGNYHGWSRQAGGTAERNFSGQFDAPVCPTLPWYVSRRYIEYTAPAQGYRYGMAYEVDYEVRGLRVVLADTPLDCSKKGPATAAGGMDAGGSSVRTLAFVVPPGPAKRYFAGRSVGLPVYADGVVEHRPGAAVAYVENSSYVPLPPHLVTLQMQSIQTTAGGRIRGKLRYEAPFRPEVAARQPYSFAQDFDVPFCARTPSGPPTAPGPETIPAGDFRFEPPIGADGGRQHLVARVHTDPFTGVKYLHALDVWSGQDWPCDRRSLRWGEQVLLGILRPGGVSAIHPFLGYPVPVPAEFRHLAEGGVVWGRDDCWAQFDRLDFDEGGRATGELYCEYGAAGSGKALGRFEAQVCAE